MDFYDDGTFTGGVRMSRSQLRSRIEDLHGKIEDENEKREELLSKLRRTERAIEQWRELLRDMEALLR
ncbi:MAG: hypothetical protein IJX64_02510 [Clostridia bacterium]|nr:hypothetical protein [Clostridia bacterium]